MVCVSPSDWTHWHRLERYKYQHCLIARSSGMISIWWSKFRLVESFWIHPFPRVPLSVLGWNEHVVQVKYTNPSSSNVAQQFKHTDMCLSGKVWLLTGRWDAWWTSLASFRRKSDFFWIKSSAKRAFGECLGSKRRWRTWYSAISVGEPRIGFDPAISEWGNPPDSLLLLPYGINNGLKQVLNTWIHRVLRANPGNWNI